MTYEAWRITYQSSEAAARAAYNTVEKLHEENQALRKHVDGLQAALGAQVRFGSEGFLAAIEKLPRYTYNYASEDGKFLLRDEVLAAIASQARQATPTTDMGNTTSQPPAATEAGNPASGAQDKMSTTQQPAALRLARKLEEAGFVGDHRLAQTRWCSEAASELRRLHAENQDLRTRHYCNTAEIESLQDRVQELGEMARENRSKRVIELERRIAEMEEQMAAIGAGGVEPLRKRAEVAPQAVQAAVPLPLLVRDIARDLGITVPQACIALKPLGNYSTNSAVTAEMARMLRDHFPAPAHPAEGVPAQTTRDAVIQHLTNAGVLEHDGCGIFIASGDASELIDACMALSTHAHHEKGAAAQAVQDAVPEAREALAKRLIADVQVAATIATAACQRVAELPDRASPADWPEAMLVTGDELHMIVREAVIEAQTAPAHPAEGVPAQGGTPGPWRVRKRTNDVGEVLDCFVTAPDCQGRAYDAHILGDDYDSIDLKLADAELVVAAVNAFRATATQPAAQGMDARDAAFEAVRKAFCKLQRYSFFLDGAGNVRRCADHCGNWVEFDAVHTLFEPQSVDAAIAAQAKQGEQ